MKKVCFLLAMAAGLVFSPGSWAGSYQGLNPEVFGLEGREAKITPQGTRIVGPDQRWAWFNSWHIIRVQPGIFGSRKDRGPYTLINSCDIKDGIGFRNFTWAHYSYFLYRSDLPEHTPRLLRIISDRIRKEWDQDAYVVRVDKLRPNLYVATYSASGQRGFGLREVEGYPPFPPQISRLRFSSTRLEIVDRTGRLVIPLFSSEFYPIIINPAICERSPTKRVSIPYGFFKKNFIYEHPRIKEEWESYGDPLLIAITPYGVVVYF